MVNKSAEEICEENDCNSFCPLYDSSKRLCNYALYEERSIVKERVNIKDIYYNESVTKTNERGEITW